MPKIIFKIIPALIFWGIFIFAIFKVPYPESLAQANLGQMGLFFVPLFLALIFTINIFFRNILCSFSIALGIAFLLILKALDSLNIVTGLLILISVGLLLSYFKRARRGIGVIRGIRGIKGIRGIRKIRDN